ncbi:MAG: AAA family ATPase [Acidobacteria bacterium]|nr:AAA family ATPase [Acidobacteriota bacterium]
MSLKPNTAVPKSTFTNPNLILDSLAINNYRCFGNVSIENLGKVNLFLGKNNVGKTALLEALYLFANNGRQDTLANIINHREEIQTLSKFDESQGAYKSWALENLFRNRPAPADMSGSGKGKVTLSISSLKDPLKKVSIGFFQRESEEPYTTLMHVHNLKKFPIHFARLQRLDESEIENLWKQIEMTPLEDFVTQSLRILSSELVSVRLMEDTEGSGKKVLFARIRSHRKPVRLRSLGFGINRLFEIMLQAVNCKNGMLLIDEIESGVHHSALKDIWEALFEISNQLNIQMFITGGGRNANESFHEAAGDNYSGKAVFQLDRVEDNIFITTLDEELVFQRFA